MSETYDLYQQGRAHLKKGRAAQATVALEKAKRREPEKASIREALGIAYLRIQRYAEAEQEFRVMLELSPADHYAHYGLGRALEKQGKQSEANGHYKLASSLRPQNEHYASRILDLDQEGDQPNEPDELNESGEADAPNADASSSVERSGWWVTNPHPGWGRARV